MTTHTLSHSVEYDENKDSPSWNSDSLFCRCWSQFRFISDSSSFFFLGNIEDILRMILPLTCSAVAKKQFQDSANGRVLVDYTTLRESISTESKSLIFFFSTFCNAMMTICWHVCMMDTVFAVVLRTHFGRCSRCFDCLVSPCLSVLHNIFFFCFITGTFLFFDFLFIKNAMRKKSYVVTS